MLKKRAGETATALGISIVIISIIAVVVVGMGWISFGEKEEICPTGTVLCDDGLCKASCVIVPPVEPPVDKLATNLVFHAPLKTDAIDKVSGKAGAITSVVFENGYAKFSGGSSNIKYPYDSSTLNPNGIGVSVCVRIDDPTKHSYFVSKYNSYATQNFAFNNATRQFHRFDGLIYENSSEWSSAGKYSAVAGTWYNVIMNYDGYVEKLYVNKILDASSTLNYQIPNDATYGVMIGNRGDNLQRGLVGAIKNARIYSKPMTSEQITLAYNECFA